MNPLFPEQSSQIYVAYDIRMKIGISRDLILRSAAGLDLGF